MSGQGIPPVGDRPAGGPALPVGRGEADGASFQRLAVVGDRARDGIAPGQPAAVAAAEDGGYGQKRGQETTDILSNHVLAYRSRNWSPDRTPCCWHLRLTKPSYQGPDSPVLLRRKRVGQAFQPDGSGESGWKAYVRFFVAGVILEGHHWSDGKHTRSDQAPARKNRCEEINGPQEG